MRKAKNHAPMSMKEEHKKKTRSKYFFVLAPEYHTSGTTAIEILAYTKKQAVAYFRKVHGRTRYCNIIKEKI